MLFLCQKAQDTGVLGRFWTQKAGRADLEQIKNVFFLETHRLGQPGLF